LSSDRAPLDRILHVRISEETYRFLREHASRVGLKSVSEAARFWLSFGQMVASGLVFVPEGRARLLGRSYLEVLRGGGEEEAQP